MVIPKCKKYNGFTLIEIIVTMAILTIVCTTIFSMFSYNTNVFKNSTSQSNVQSNARIAMDYITKETRYATDLSIIPVATCKNDISNKILYNNKNYSYIYVENGSINQAIYNGSQYTTKTILSSNSNNGNYFTKIDNSTLGINVTCNDGKKTFSLASNAILSNFVLITPAPTLSGSSDIAIRYITTMKPIALYTDLVNFEKNMLSIVGTNAGISFGTNNTFNPNGSILMQGTDLTLNGLGNNLNGNIAIKADTLNLGSGQTGTSNGETIFDVKKLTGSFASYNSTFYVYHDILVPKPQNANSWNAIESYNGTFWSYLFAKQGDGITIPMSVRTLKNNINFTDAATNPATELNPKIHYFSGNTVNEIKDNHLPNYNGNMSAAANVNSSNYEYIICHGPLKIDTTDPNNGSFNFKGIIYCDDIVTFNDMSSSFKGIIISRGLKALNVIGTQNHNWNIEYNKTEDSVGDINKFNTIIGNATNP